MSDQDSNYVVDPPDTTSTGPSETTGETAAQEVQEQQAEQQAAAEQAAAEVAAEAARKRVEDYINSGMADVG